MGEEYRFLVQWEKIWKIVDAKPARQARNENPDDPLPSRPFSFPSSSIFNFHVFRLTMITMSYCCLPRSFSKEDQNLRIKPALADQGLLNPTHRISQSKMGFLCNMWRHGLSYKRLCFLFYRTSSQ